MNWTSLSGAGSSPIRADSLSTPFHKYNHVCDEGFLAQTRRERRAYPSAVCKERATTCGPKSTVARRVASLFGSGFVAPRSQPPLRGMLPRRASPEPKIDATNVVVFIERGTKLPGVKNILAALVLCSVPARAAAQEDLPQADEIIQSVEDWVRDNLDDNALEELGIDKGRVQQFLTELQRRFQGAYVYDLGALRETASNVLPVLQEFDETRPLAVWLQP